MWGRHRRSKVCPSLRPVFVTLLCMTVAQHDGRCVHIGMCCVVLSLLCVPCDAAPCNGSSFYCPAGTNSRQVVSTGYYSTPESSSELYRTGQAQCDGGHYCVNGTRLPCGAGTYSTSVQLFTPCTTPCIAGTDHDAVMLYGNREASLQRHVDAVLGTVLVQPILQGTTVRQAPPRLHSHVPHRACTVLLAARRLCPWTSGTTRCRHLGTPSKHCVPQDRTVLAAND